MRVYVKPMMDSEVFAANEYCSACGDENRVYKFVCNAGYILGSGGNVYVDSNHNGELDFGTDENLGAYHQCQETHEAPTDDEFIDGFLTGFLLPFPKKVKIWTDGGTNVHCTTNLDMDSWETAKS